MNWLEVSYEATEENYEVVSHFFIQAGSKGVALEDSGVPHAEYGSEKAEVYRLNPDDYPSAGVVVKGYFAELPGVGETIAGLKAQLQGFAEGGMGAFLVSVLAEEDWSESWKSGYEPIQVSDRLVIKPSWFETTTDGSQIEIRLDPGMAFGSGTHETTRLSLQLLLQHVKADSYVVDVGCGSGVLSIAAAKLGAASVYGVDVDPMAVKRAEENAQLNACDIAFRTGDLMNGMDGLGWQPTIVVANLIAHLIVEMLPDVKKVLVDDGIFICSGIIAEEKEAMMHALETSGFEVLSVVEENGWLGIVVKRCV